MIPSYKARDPEVSGFFLHSTRVSDTKFAITKMHLKDEVVCSFEKDAIGTVCLSIKFDCRVQEKHETPIEVFSCQFDERFYYLRDLIPMLSPMKIDFD